MLSDFIFIAFLILANGFFAAAEMAVISSRKVRLQVWVEEGNSRALRALRLRENPAEFLTTVQVGITLVATLASAVGGLEAARRLGPRLTRIPALAPYADQIALGIVVLIITYTSLLFGELVPKRLAIRNPESFAMVVAPFFEYLAKIIRVPIWFLMVSANLVMRLFKEESDEDQFTSTEEIEVLVRRGTAEGVILPLQERMITRVFDYAGRSTRDEMTPRTEIVALDVNTSIEAALDIAKEHGYSRFPVYLGNLDHILGYVHIKDLIWAQPDTSLKTLTRPAVYIPEGVSLPQAFTTLTRSGLQLGIVLDEYGGTEGLITLENLLEVIVGEIEDEHSPLADLPEKHAEDVWEFNGSTAIVEVGQLLGIEFNPNGVYTTLAGFIMTQLGAIPKEGDTVLWKDFCFTIEEMDKFRILRVCVQHLKK
jgi:putative hemolysin